MDAENKSHSGTKRSWWLIGTLASAIGASICCLGPLILVGLGFSGAWIGNLASFERYRPLFMLIAFGFLAFAFYKVYSKPKGECCQTDSYCANPKADRMNKIALWGVTVLIVGMLISPNMIPILASNNNTAQSTPVKQVVLNVEGMTCAACSVTVKKSLERVDGVQKANVMMNPLEAIVIYDPAKVSVEQLIEATKNVGYPTSIKGGN